MPDTPMPDQPEFDAADPDFDGQDMAEIWDEDNQSPDSARIAGKDGLTFEEMPSLFDSTSAEGDDDDDEAVIGEDLDDSEIVELSLDGEDDDREDDDLRMREADAFADEDEDELDLGEDPDDRDGVARLGADEVELEYVGDLTDTRGALSGAQRYESSRLSDEDIDRLGYGDRAGKASPSPQPKSFDARDTDPAVTAHGKTPTEHAQAVHDDDLLDEGLEETFPASDPVSAKHIT